MSRRLFNSTLRLAQRAQFVRHLRDDLHRRDLLPMLVVLTLSLYLGFAQLGLPLTFSVLPVFVWISLRFSTALTLTIVTVTVTVLAALTVYGLGPFGTLPPAPRLAVIQAASLIVAGIAATLSLYRDQGKALLSEVRAAHENALVTAARLADSEQIFRKVFSDAPVGILMTTTPGAGPITIQTANETLEAMLGVGPLPGLPLSRIVQRRDVVEFVAAARLTSSSGETQHVDVSLESSHGELIGRLSISRMQPLAADDPFLIVTAADVTGVHQDRQQMTFLAQHDHLTGLPNRAHFDTHLADLISDPVRSQHPVGLLYLDLDGFKTINDTFGHDAGDEVLRKTAQRLANQVREAEFVARLGGDEFAVLVPRTSPNGLQALTRRLQQALTEPIGEHGHQVGASIGSGILLPGEGAAEFVRRVDQSMYVAKVKNKAQPTTRQEQQINLAERG